MSAVIKHATLTGAAANSRALVDGPKWDAEHTVEGVGVLDASNAWSGTHTFAISPNLAGPGFAGIYGISETPALAVSIYNGVQFSLGTSIPASKQFGADNVGIQQAIVGTATVKAADTTTTHAAGVAGYALTAQASGANTASAVGVFGQAGASVSGANVFGGNFGANNTNGDNTVTGFDVNFIAGLEVDVNLWKTGAGVNPVVAGGHAYGVIVAGSSNISATPTGASGVYVTPLSTLTSVAWDSGFSTAAGAAQTALLAGPLTVSSPSQPSQAVSFQGRNASSALKTASINADLNGALLLKPAATSTVVALQNGSDVTLLQTGAGYGSAGVNMPSLTVAGVLTNDTSGNVSSTATTGSGSFVRATSPALVTPSLGAATATSINGNTFTTGSYTLTGVAGKALTFNNSLTLAGTDGTTMTFPTTSAALARTDAGQTFTGTQVFSSTITGSISGNAATVTTNANLTGDVTSVGNATTLTNAPVIAKVLTGYTSGAGTVSAADSILAAIQKLNGNDATNANLTGDVTSIGNATTLTNAPVIAKVLTGYTSGAGTVSATDSILAAIQKLNGNDATNANLTGDVTSVGNATTFTGKTGGALGQIPGTTTNDDASAGNVGQYLYAGGGASVGAGSLTATITIASPAVVTMSAHGFSNTGSSPVVYTTTGALPTGITAGTTYWTVPGTVTTNTFQIATSPVNAFAGTSINTSGSQSGTHTGAETIPLTTATNTNFAAVNLTAGDWQVGGSVGFSPAGTTSVIYWAAWTNTVSAAADQQPGHFYGQNFSDAGVVLGSTLNSQFALPTRRVTVANGSTQIIYGGQQASFSISTMGGYGTVWARRVR